MTVSHVLFDLGRVVLDWEPSRLYTKIFPDPTERDHFLATVCTMAWHTRHDAGVSFHENRVDLIAAYPQYEAAIRAWGERWMEMFDGYIAGVPDLIDQLDARAVPLYALSNMPAEVWPDLQDTYAYLRRFRHVVVSGEIGRVKPDPTIYHHARAKMGDVPADRVLFIDDSLKNIEAARTLGFAVHHFKTARGLAMGLTHHGLL